MSSSNGSTKIEQGCTVTTAQIVALFWGILSLPDMVWRRQNAPHKECSQNTQEYKYKGMTTTPPSDLPLSDSELCKKPEGLNVFYPPPPTSYINI